MLGTKALLSSASLLLFSATLYAGAFAAAPAAMTPQQRVDAAYKAMGGDALAKLKTVIVKYKLQQWDPGESYALTKPLEPRIGEATVSMIRDLEHGTARKDYAITKDDDHTTKTFTEIVTPAAGFVIGNDANPGRLPKRATPGNRPQHTMSGPRLEFSLRELERDAAVLEMKAHPERVTAIEDQKVGGKTYPSLQLKGLYGTFIVMFDPAQNFPARVRTLDWDALEGDSTYDAIYSDWRDVKGVRLPFHVQQDLNGFKVAAIDVTDVTPNMTVGPTLLQVPAAFLAKAEKPAAQNRTPMQWIIRRKFSGFYLDSASYYYDDGGTLTLADVAPNISQTQGATHNTIFIDAGTYLVAVEAPNDDGQSKLALALAAKKYPGKPVKYLILTHHHVDHVGGMRTYAAMGATIVVGPGDGAYFKRVLARPQTLNPNAPANMPAMPKVIEVSGKWKVPDGGMEVDAYPIANPHAADMLIVYVPDAKLGIVTDLWNPGPVVTASNPMLKALVAGVEKLKLAPERFAGGHGAVGSYSQMATIVKAAK